MAFKNLPFDSGYGPKTLEGTKRELEEGSKNATEGRRILAMFRLLKY